MAGQHVDLVAVGERDENVGAGDAGGFEDSGARRIADHGANVEPVLQIAQHVVIRIDDGDVVRFLARKVVCRGTPDLPGA